jgi:hypothetical protein
MNYWDREAFRVALRNIETDEERIRQSEAVFDRERFAYEHLRGRRGEPWEVRDYQRESLACFMPRKVHCDGRDVGKTAEIEVIASWASVALHGREMLIATQCEHHLFPLMNRVVRRFEENDVFAASLVEIKRTPSWYARFSNGFTLWGRIAGPRGVNFQGMHVDFQVVDEAQEMTETSWGELYQALNGHGWRWVYGVPNGRRDTFYRMTQLQDAAQFNWPSRLNPEFSDEKDAELQRLYGGARAPGYIHRVLGQHGAPAHGVFDLDDYLECIDDGLAFESVELVEGDRFDAGPVRQKGRYYLGCDLGFARDPSEFVVFESCEPHYVNVLRVHLAGVNYARQRETIEELDRAYGFRVIAIDCGNNGRAVAHELMSNGADWCERVRPVEFGSTIDLEPLPDGTIVHRPVKEFMTELLQRRLAERTIVLPRLAVRESQYAAHSYRVGYNGRIVYEKGNDHLIDADRCAVLARWLDTRDPGVTPPLAPKLEGF